MRTSIFKELPLDHVFGTANQTFIPAISDIETEVGVNAPVTNAASVTRTITDSNIDAVRVTIRFDALININEKVW